MQVLHLGHNVRGVLHQFQHRTRGRYVGSPLQPPLYGLEFRADRRRHAAQLLLRSLCAHVSAC